MRNAFADELTKLGSEDGRVVLLSGDIGNKLFDKFKAKCPNRFYNCGVAEANMMGVAAGMAMSGLRPVVYTITPFVTTRCLEQIRVDVCYHNVPVIIVAVGAGLSYASLGPTHHACEDISLLRSLPGMAVVCPGDPHEVRAGLRTALAAPGPVYLRLGKKGEPNVHAGTPTDFTIGRGIVMQEGEHVCIFSTGNVLPVAMEAAEDLATDGHSTRVVSLHTVKPLDEALLREAFARFNVVATIEEHSLIGGLGGAVAEWRADNPDGSARLIRFASKDAFFKLSGKQEFARKQLGLTREYISEHLRHALA